jgi:O-antigen ligase
MRSAAALQSPSSAASLVGRALERAALAGVVGHAVFLPISVAGTQIALAVSAGALVLLRVGGRRVWAKSALDLPVLLLCGAAVLSIIAAALTGYPPPAWREAVLWRSFLAAPVVLSALQLGEASAPGSARRWALVALGAWAAASLIPSALAWAQYWTGVDPLHALGLRATPVHAAAKRYDGHYAAVGFFRWYQRLAHNLLPPLSIAAAVALRREVGGKLRALLALAAVAAAAAVVLTMSRAAWVSLALAIFVLALLSGRLRRFAVPLTVAACVAMLALPAVRARVAHLAVPGDNDDRRQIWGVCGAMVADRPLVGFGWGSVPQRSQPYYDRIAPWCEVRAWCHDTYLSAWVEGGPLLTGAVVAFFALLALAAWRWRARGDGLASAAASGAIAAIAATVANSLVHDLLYSSEATFGLMFALAIAAALARGASAARSSSGASA